MSTFSSFHNNADSFHRLRPPHLPTTVFTGNNSLQSSQHSLSQAAVKSIQALVTSAQKSSRSAIAFSRALVKYVLKHSQCCDSALAPLLEAVILYPSTRAESELGMWNKSLKWNLMNFAHIRSHSAMRLFAPLPSTLHPLDRSRLKYSQLTLLTFLALQKRS